MPANDADPVAAPARIYLDHAATTPLRAEVAEVLDRAAAAYRGNPSSLHAEGRAARAALEDARARLVAALDGDGWRAVFTSGGTESILAAILGSLLARRRAGPSPTGAPAAPASGLDGLHVVTSAVEHPAVLETVALAESLGARVSRVPPDPCGRVRAADVEAAIAPSTALVSIQAVNNELGTVQPIDAIGARVRARGVVLHTDAVQLLGRAPLALRRWPADLVSIAGHKVGGPKGVGALLIREGTPLEAWQRGGGQEGGLRGGTESVAAALGLARAVELAVAEQPEETPRLAGVLALLRESLAAAAPRLRFLTPGEGAAPHILSLLCEGIVAETLLLRLDACGVAVSTGSACQAAARKPSHVPQAIGLSPRDARSVIRFSIGRETRPEHVVEAARRFAAVVEILDPLVPRA